MEPVIFVTRTTLHVTLVYIIGRSLKLKNSSCYKYSFQFIEGEYTKYTKE
jgi:hypothetical protein